MTTSTLLLILVCLLPLGCSTSADSNPPAAKPTVASTTSTTPTTATPVTSPRASGFYALSATDIDGQPDALAPHAGKVTLVVNTASECGYTPQYDGLQKLHTELASRGFAVIGVPSNDFGGQEPGSAAEIKTFCSERFHVTFPMLAKAVTKSGSDQSPIFGYLEKETGKLPSWNFCKYLVGKDGKVIAFYPSKVTPNDAELRKAIEDALAKS